MSFCISLPLPAIRCTSRIGVSPLRNLRPSQPQPVVLSFSARFASNSSPPHGSARHSSAQGRRRTNEVSAKRQIDASRKAALLLSRLSSVGKQAAKNESKEMNEKRRVPAAATAVSARETSATSASTAPKSETVASKDDLPVEVENIEGKNIEIDAKEEAIQKRILLKRRKLLWPGIWTMFAVAGTYGALAYWDVKYNPEAASGTIELSERTQIPQSWFLTPTIIKEGLRAGWNELDKLTIGIVLASVAIHFMKRSPLPFWENLIHITGEKKYTAFTYPFVHSNWAHIGQNMFGLIWFLPGVVRYFDGDLFHTAAFFMSVPLITSYLQHLAFRWGSVKGLPLNMGSSGAIAAVFGAFCMAYPDEKVWTPSFVILRLDAKYWGALFAFWQLAAMVKTPRGGNRPAFIVHIVSLGLGAAYVYFDGQGNVWKPLISRLSKDQRTSIAE